jgi:allophanate hydrolase subunit 2
MCVIAADVPRAAQLRPGDAAVLQLVGYRDAAVAFVECAEKLRSLAPLDGDGARWSNLSRGFEEGWQQA